MTLSSVDWPEPDGPVIASQSPCSSARSTPVRAWTTGPVPYCFPTPMSSRTLARRTASTPAPRAAVLRSRTLMSIGALRILVPDDHELARLEPALDRGDLDVAAGRQPGRDRKVLERAVVLDLDPRAPVGGEGQRADRHRRDRPARRLDRDGDPHGEALEPHRRLVDLDLEVDVEAVDPARAGRAGHHLDHARRPDAERPLVEGHAHPRPDERRGIERQGGIDGELVVRDR